MSSQEIRHNLPSVNNATIETHRVLIVDDEPAICFAYRKLLINERFGFDICDNVNAAIDFLKMNDYYAVISDVRFAGIGNEDGVYLVSVARKERPQATVILVTGYGSDELKKTTLELGASHYFEKPVNPSSIVSLLRELHVIADQHEENETLKSLLLSNSHAL